MPKKREPQPDMFSLRCEACNRYLILTESGYWSCPQARHNVVTDTYDAPRLYGAMFPDDLEKANEDARS